jgi:histidine triad (HIT) family protein
MNDKPKKCIFCRIISGEKPEIHIAENERFITLLDIEQKSKAHSIIILREHHKSVEGMDDQDWSLMLPILKESVEKINKCHHPIGFNLHSYSSEKEGLHLQSVPHFHLHIVPLYEKHYGHN